MREKSSILLHRRATRRVSSGFDKLVTEDLIDPEAFTQEWSTYVAKGKNHRYGLCFTWDIANIDNNTDYVMLPALTGPDGVRKYHQTE